MSKTTAIPMDKEIQSFQFIFTGQQYFEKIPPPKSNFTGIREGYLCYFEFYRTAIIINLKEVSISFGM